MRANQVGERLDLLDEQVVGEITCIRLLEQLADYLVRDWSRKQPSVAGRRLLVEVRRLVTFTRLLIFLHPVETVYRVIAVEREDLLRVFDC